jgi:F0F1-type ATP synthase membrane subunit b/b'
MKNSRTHYWKLLTSILMLCFFFISYSLAQTTNAKTDYEKATISSSSEISEVNTHEKVSYIEIQSDEEVCKSANPCQQFGKFAEPVINKSVDNSQTISNLSNMVYIVTAIILAITLLVLLFSLVPPVMIFSLRKRQEEFKDSLNETLKEMKNENARLRQEMKDLKNTVHKDLQDEFRDEFMDILTKKINTRIKRYEKLVAQQMLRQSNQHEERLYYVEEVRSELLKQSRPKEISPDSLSEWILEQQRDYFALMQLISPHEEDTFLALNTFRNRENLPDSFLKLLRFLDKKDRLPGDSRIRAEKIAQDKFGKSLDQEDEVSP